MGTTSRERYRSNMDLLKKELGGACVRCGSADKLEFDHINRDTKEFTISHMGACSIERLREEAKKCQLLCRPCHVLKCKEDGSFDAIKNHVARGESNGSAVLTEELVRQILSEDGPYCVLAEKFGVSEQTVSRVKRGVSWTHVYEETSSQESLSQKDPSWWRRGSTNPKAVLTESQAYEILASSDPTNLLMEKYKVNRSTINRIRRRETWTHLSLD